MAKGKVVQVIGSVVDIEFPADAHAGALQRHRDYKRSTAPSWCWRPRRTWATTGCGVSLSCPPTAWPAAWRPSTPAPPSRCRWARPRWAHLQRSGRAAGQPRRGQGHRALVHPPRPPRFRRAGDHHPGAGDGHQGHRPHLPLRPRRQDRRLTAAPAWARRLSSRSSSAPSPPSTAAISVFAGVGERSREGNDLWHEMKTSGVIEQDGAGIRPDERAARRASAHRPYRPHHGRVLPRCRAPGRAALHR